jgi:hypothetical protein
MNTHHRVFALLFPLALAHCSNEAYQEPTSTVTGASLELDPDLDADSGAPLPIVVGQPWIVGSQMLVSSIDCGDTDNFSVSQYYTCTTVSDRPVQFDVVSVSCDDDACEVLQQEPWGGDGTPLYYDVNFTILVKSTSTTLHVTTQMTGNPAVTAQQDYPIAASLPLLQPPVRPRG